MIVGASIIGELLRNAAAVTAIVAIGQIKAGALPDNAELPAILIRTISSVERQQLKRGAFMRTVDRVAVTVRTASWREQVALIQIIKNTCTGRTGNIGGGVRVAILSAGIGPDVRSAGNSFEQTHDFRVSYDAN